MHSTRIQPLFIVGLALAVYYVLERFIPFGGLLTYPFKLIVTMLHEFGHALGALLTGGQVDSIQINANGGGWCKTAGGMRGIVLMGGYLGSAIFGNILLYMGYVYPRLSKYVLYALTGMMIIIATIWSASIMNTLFILPFLAAVVFINRTQYNGLFLMILGALSVAHILFDYNVGPTSDLAKYAELWPVMSAQVWMYVWLAFALGITYFNVRRMKSAKSKQQSRRAEKYVTK